LNFEMPWSSTWIIFPSLSRSVLFSYTKIYFDWFLKRSSMRGIWISFPFLSSSSICVRFKVRLFSLLVLGFSAKLIFYNLRQRRLYCNKFTFFLVIWRISWDFRLLWRFQLSFWRRFRCDNSGVKVEVDRLFQLMHLCDVEGDLFFFLSLAFCVGAIFP
jgi:hypothetical protein